MAEEYLKYKLKEMKLDNKIAVSSCGTNALNGEEVTPYSVVAINEYGVKLEKHSAINMFESDIIEADYIFAMTKQHKDVVSEAFPNLKGKIHLLKEYMPGVTYMNVDDPWGLSLPVYINCAREIVECIDNLIYEFTKKV